MNLIKNTIKHKALFFMVLPGAAIMFAFSYMPMFGLAVAFKSFDYSRGIWGSSWVGLDNFKFLFTSKDITLRLIRNTVAYWFLFTVTGTVSCLALALILHECVKKRLVKIAHTIMIFPTFISWIAVAFIVKALLDNQTGMINYILSSLSLEPVNWYAEPSKWPMILLIVNLLKGTGYGAIIYLSALAGMDRELYEAAELDGAGKWKQMWYITLPMLMPMISIMTLMSLGGIMTSNTGLFYQVTKNVSLLYPTTQTIDSYVMNALTSGTTDFGLTSAVTFFQTMIGFAMVLFTNFLVRRWEPDYALF